jgi:hypothetical protein
VRRLSKGENRNVLTPEELLDALPQHYMSTPYVYEIGPEADPALGLTAGANCQRFAYTVLAWSGLTVPPHRSSELWADEDAITTVATPLALDLVLYGIAKDAFGAHVGVYIGDVRVLHLCKEVGVPVVWDDSDFAARPAYHRVGFKRVRS